MQPNQRPAEPSLIVRLIRPVEFISIAIIIFGILFKLQSWPYASVMLLAGFLGLFTAYAVLFPIRLHGLRGAIDKTPYHVFMASSIALGVLLMLAGISLLSILEHNSVLFWAATGLRIVALVVISASLVYSIVKRQGAPNTIQQAVSSWLFTRQMIIVAWVIFGLVSQGMRASVL